MLSWSPPGRLIVPACLHGGSARLPPSPMAVSCYQGAQNRQNLHGKSRRNAWEQWHRASFHRHVFFNCPREIISFFCFYSLPLLAWTHCPPESQLTGVSIFMMWIDADLIDIAIILFNIILNWIIQIKKIYSPLEAKNSFSIYGNCQKNKHHSIFIAKLGEATKTVK